MEHDNKQMLEGYESLSTYRFLKKCAGTILMQRKYNDRTLSLLSAAGIGKIFQPRFANPIFIIGSPRSGTSILGRLFNAIPNVSYYREPQIVKYYAKHIAEGMVSEFRQRIFFKLIYGSLYRLAARSGRKFVEKNPGNVFIARNLIAVFPSARFIHIVRDGRDVACSLLEKPWHLGASLGSSVKGHEGYYFGPYPHYYIERERRYEFFATSDIHRCIWIWKCHVRKALQLEEELGKDTVLRIRYEDMVSDPATVIEILLDYIGENYKGTMESLAPIMQVLHSASMDKWRKKLSMEELEIINEEAGPELEKLGYPADTNAINVHRPGDLLA